MQPWLYSEQCSGKEMDHGSVVVSFILILCLDCPTTAHECKKVCSTTKQDKTRRGKQNCTIDDLNVLLLSRTICTVLTQNPLCGCVDHC